MRFSYLGRLAQVLAATTVVASLAGCVINLPARNVDGGADDTVDAVTNATCGNGRIDRGELCDTAIAAQQPGSCPQSCDDRIACTADELVDATTCQAACAHTPITGCVDGDGCCPSGCAPTNDDDCSADCGNGQLDAKETCDTAISAGQPGACPSDCEDNVVCTRDVLLNASTCAAQCYRTAIVACSDGDGCCPRGCDSSSDNDCSSSCGNGKLDAKETCDTAIAAGQPGACRASCDDGNACTQNSLLNAGTCAAQCSSTAITQCKGGDNCCPSGCDSNSDSDCSSSCGNGALESSEKCDTAIAKGQPGACPTSCDDGKSCTKDALLNAGTCDAQCNTTPITQCADGDGCCPSGCSNANDNDCSASCGNGTVDSGEDCDTAIAAGQPGACPQSCNDGKPCTKDSLLNAGTCSAQCSNTTITQCTDSDSCCPTGCNNNNDNDCSPQCGNGVVESGETCDPPSSCPTSCSAGSCKSATLKGSASQCTAECSVTNKSNGSSCSGGKCYGGSCCSGCWNGSSCKSGTSSAACGSGGGSCAQCTAGACQTATCSAGSCSTSDATDGSSCSGGTCASGSCCTTCRIGGTCHVGDTPIACGVGGAVCQDCTTSNTCKIASCTLSGSCSTSDKADGTACTASGASGVCASGKCCTTCVTATGSCSIGDTPVNCGSGGGACATCPSPGVECKVASCNSGVCGVANVPDGTSCGGGSGTCQNGSCCTGC